MHYPHQNQDPSQKAQFLPPESPWRGAHMGGEEPFRSPPGQPGFVQGSGIKLPSLPRLGGQQPQNVSQRPPNQPSFAQMVQAHQNYSPTYANPAGRTVDSRGKPQGKLPQSGERPLSASTGGKEAESDPGAQILGTVNAQTMPKVNTSYGMSSLNTVLPGMVPNQFSSGPSDNRLSCETAHNPLSMQQLTLDDRRGSAASQLSGQTGHNQEAERYGLRSLLDVLESKNNEKRSVILGSDLSQIGLDLTSSTERLSHTFASPWQETSKNPVIPDFKLPTCYSIGTVVPQQQKLQSFDEGALFYIFYTMPRDAMQEAAAVELTNRSWRYHKELKMWLTKDPLSEPVQTNNQEESGIYIFFDPTTWKKTKKEYILYYPDIA